MLEARSAYGYFGVSGGYTGENAPKRKNPKQKAKIIFRDRWGNEYEDIYPYHAVYTKETEFEKIEKLGYIPMSFEIISP